ncbi:MAG: chitobiase/beta-hexosaminidase C-terminal domain-containing protein, partial [Ignavibacteriales bacterium]|nr:chitobiase/beta-hexosaminidase C-terminal domain-containing protein [Ignavibacteriales bacterium]
GSTADNSVAIWAVGAGSNRVVKCTTTDNGATFTGTEIVLSSALSSGATTPSITPNLTGTEFYVKGQGDILRRYQINGTIIDSSASSVVATGSNALRYFEITGKKYLAIYHSGSGNENAKILDVTAGIAAPTVVATTATLGAVANANATGDVSVKSNGDGTENIYVLSTNNGIGAYKFAPPQQISAPVFTPVAGTYNVAFWMKISVNTAGAKIYYTLNNTTPDSTTGTKYIDSVKISDTSTTVKAIAYASGMITSDVATAVYKIVKLVVPPSDPLYPYWTKTAGAGTLPASFSTGNLERGMAYGKVGGKDRIYVVSRNGSPRILVFDALKGDSVGVMMPPASVTGGTFALDFVDVSDDGVIFAGNLTTDVSASSFKLYRWNSETDSAKTVVDTVLTVLTAGRVGDIISVFGKTSDNTAKVFAAVSGLNKVVKFTTNNNGAKFVANVITLANGNLGTVPSVALASDSTLFIKSYGLAMYHYSATGAVLDSISTGVVGTDVTAVKYFERLSKKYVMCFSPNDASPYTDERISIVDVTAPSAAKLAFTSPSIGKNANLNGTGAVDILPLPNDNFLAFILGTNNGLAAFSNSASLVLSTLDTLFYGNTPTLMKNPYGAGFIAGTNSYGDLGKYERFALKKDDVLAGFKTYFASKKIVGDPDTVSLVVKTVAASGKPDSTLATVILMADMIDTTKAGNVIILDNPVKLKGPIFIGFEFTKTANDTIAMYLDKDGEGNGANRVWEKFNDGTYNDFTNTTFSWGLNTDLWIAAYYKKGTTTSVTKQDVMPEGYALSQNYPNPFNPVTTIRFSLAAKAKVALTVYNVLGQRVAELVNGEMQTGVYAVPFNAAHMASGVYFYRLEAKGSDGSSFNSVKKLMLLK